MSKDSQGQTMTTDIIERLPMTSATISEDRMARLLQIFPEAFRDGRIDFDALRRFLGDQVDTGRERFGLHWPGKADCLRVIQEPSVGTLLPMREESVNFDSTENLIIEGDNLEVLKLLQKSYYGKVKVIFIDPPYNTGGEFIYPDNFREGLQDYLKYSGQVDGDGLKLSTNTESNGRYHSKWLNMMYPRLFLARNLLRDDGAIFITIDDHEMHRLRCVMDEIFGEENFVATCAWQKVFAKKNKAMISGSHDHVLIYARQIESWARNLLPRDDGQLEVFKNPDNDPRGRWQSVSFSVQSEDAERRQAYRYEIPLPSGRSVPPPAGRHWNGLPARFDELKADRRIWFGTDEDSPPRVKVFLSEVQQGIVPDTWWNHEEAGNNQEAKKEILELFGDSEPFNTPKPTRLLRRVLQIATAKETGDIVLDFFAGSGTTGDAVLRLNGEDGGNRKFILVQLPEETRRQDYPTVSSITRERVRRALTRLTGELSKQAHLPDPRQMDVGFRALRLTSSNFLPWNGDIERVGNVAKTLELFADHIVEGRSADDILAELLLRSGFALTSPVEKVRLANKDVFSVGGGAMLVCLDRELTLEVIEEMVGRAPAQIVCLDAGFQRNDQLKVNAVQAIKSRARSEETTIVLRVV